MKLLNILGAVIAAHVAVLVLAVAIPGCRSTRTNAPAADSAAGATQAAYPATGTSSPGFSAAPELSDRDLNPPLAGRGPATFDPDAPAMAGGGAGRYSPTRPGSAGASSLSTPINDLPSAPPSTPAATYTVQRGDNLWSLAKRNGISVRKLAAANNLPADSMLRLNQVLVIPAKSAPPAAGSTPGTTAATGADSGTPSRSYVIQSGDTLGRIARRHNVTVAELKAFNGLTSDMVRAGDTLEIPEAAPSATGSGASAGAAVTSTSTPPPASGTATANPPASGGSYKHVVAFGESLTVIAKRYGISVGAVAEANQIQDPSMIRPGQELIIPGVPAAGPANVARSPAGATPPRSTPANPTTNPPPANPNDLDAGLSTTLDNVPVIDVERSSTEEEPPIQTINVGGGGGPPRFE